MGIRCTSIFQLFLGTGLALSAIGNITVHPAAAKDGPRIAFVVGNVNDAFYKKVLEGARAEANRLGVVLLDQGPNEFSPQLQIPIVELPPREAGSGLHGLARTRFLDTPLWLLDGSCH